MSRLATRTRIQYRYVFMNLRKSKLFQRKKMQPLRPKDYPKVAVIIGIIVIPPILLLVI